MSAKQPSRHTKYVYEKSEETVQVPSNRHETSRMATKKPKETAWAPNDYNK